VIGTQTHQSMLLQYVQALAGYAREVSAPRGPRQIVIRDNGRARYFFLFFPASKYVRV